MRKTALAMAGVIALTGCASQSGKTFAEIDRSNPAFQSDACQSAIKETVVHDDLKLVRLIASPIALILSAGTLLPAVVATNVGLDTVDRVDASKMDQRCGGQGQSPSQIAEGVVKGAAFGIATNAAGGAVMPSMGSSLSGVTPGSK